MAKHTALTLRYDSAEAEMPYEIELYGVLLSMSMVDEYELLVERPLAGESPEAKALLTLKIETTDWEKRVISKEERESERN